MSKIFFSVLGKQAVMSPIVIGLLLFLFLFGFAVLMLKGIGPTAPAIAGMILGGIVLTVIASVFARRRVSMAFPSFGRGMPSSPSSPMAPRPMAVTPEKAAPVRKPSSGGPKEPEQAKSKTPEASPGRTAAGKKVELKVDEAATRELEAQAKKEMDDQNEANRVAYKESVKKDLENYERSEQERKNQHDKEVEANEKNKDINKDLLEKAETQFRDDERVYNKALESHNKAVRDFKEATKDFNDNIRQNVSLREGFRNQWLLKWAAEKASGNELSPGPSDYKEDRKGFENMTQKDAEQQIKPLLAVLDKSFKDKVASDQKIANSARIREATERIEAEKGLSGADKVRKLDEFIKNTQGKLDKNSTWRTFVPVAPTLSSEIKPTSPSEFTLLKPTFKEPKLLPVKEIGSFVPAQAPAPAPAPALVKAKAVSPVYVEVPVVAAAEKKVEAAVKSRFETLKKAVSEAEQQAGAAAAVGR